MATEKMSIPKAPKASSPKMRGTSASTVKKTELQLYTLRI